MLPETTSLNITNTPFLTFLGYLVCKGKAWCISNSVAVGGCVNTLALLDSGSEISVMRSNNFAEVARAMVSLSNSLQVETCNIIITSYTQDTSPTMTRAWVNLTFQEMTLVHPIYICLLDTEPLLLSQDLLDHLAQSLTATVDTFGLSLTP